MKRIFKTAFAIFASFFITKTEAKTNEINSRVIRLRKALSEDNRSKEASEDAKKMVDYFAINHDLTSSLNSEKTAFTDAWHNNPNWSKFDNWDNWNNWLKWHNWYNY
jgi:hypothetical protein